MKTLNLIYALKGEKLVHISDVERGLKCGCNCQACGEILVAKKGDKVMHHFAHKSTIECEYGYQTSLHLAAKKVISENGIIQVPALCLTFPETGRKELLEPERILNVSNVILEKKLDNIIPDILLMTDIGKIIVEIFVTHEIDTEKKKKIKRLGIPTIEIDLSNIDRNISEEDLQEVLIKKNEHKTWIYNGKREETYKKFVEVCDSMEVITRNYALHVDNCPVRKRVWRQKPYANFTDDCLECEYFIAYKCDRKDDIEYKRILCSGRKRIAHVSDFDVPLEKRVQNYDDKREEEIYELVGQGICPQCGCDLVIRHSKFGEFFGCSNYPHCRFTFNYEDE